MSMTEWEIGKLDQQYGRVEDSWASKNPDKLCPKCGCRLIIARGVAGEQMQILPAPTCPNCGFEKLEAKARRTDPDTSHAAAASVRNIRESQAFVLWLLESFGPMTDEEICFHCQGRSPSGIRTRRSELVRLGKVEYAGYKAVMSTGRMARVWKAV